MNVDLLHNVKNITKNFIELNYSDELPFFDAFWEVFSIRIYDVIKTDTSNNLILKPVSQLMNQVSFSSILSNDFKTPIAALTIFEVINMSMEQDYSIAQLEDIVHSIAAKYKAIPSLTACLLKHLPAMCMDIKSCPVSGEQAVVKQSVPPVQYRIWTEGKQMIVDSIETYKENINSYLIWIDLDAKKCYLHKSPKITLDPKAVKLFIFLVENLGNRMSITDILSKVYDDIQSDDPKLDRNKIAVQLSQLSKFSRGKIKPFIFSKWRQDGLGLNIEFKDKYFMFKRAIKQLD